MDGIKIFAKSEREVNGLVSTVQILSNDIGMEFEDKEVWCTCIEKGKVVSYEGV